MMLMMPKKAHLLAKQKGETITLQSVDLERGKWEGPVLK